MKKREVTPKIYQKIVIQVDTPRSWGCTGCLIWAFIWLLIIGLIGKALGA